jgi:hypothetical protein
VFDEIGGRAPIVYGKGRYSGDNGRIH